MAGPADFDTIKTAILHRTTNDAVVIPMLVGAGLESRWNINAPGGGAFQIIDAGRYSPSEAITHGGASQIQADVDYMLPRYMAASVIHAAEKDGPDKYANIAHDAERPARRYQDSQGEATVTSIYTTVVQNYGKAGAQATVTPTQVSPLSGVAGFANQALSVLKWLATPANWVRILEVALGAGLLVVGIHAMVTGGSASGSASTLKGHVARVATKAVFV